MKWWRWKKILWTAKKTWHQLMVGWIRGEWEEIIIKLISLSIFHCFRALKARHWERLKPIGISAQSVFSTSFLLISYLSVISKRIKSKVIFFSFILSAQFIDNGGVGRKKIYRSTTLSYTTTIFNDHLNSDISLSQTICGCLMSIFLFLSPVTFIIQ